MKTNFLKLGLAFAAILAFSFGNAQTTDPTDVSTTQAEADGEVIRLIDNKGTIKYLQSNNGITTITSTVAGNLTTTTWQLGGTLNSNTEITLNDGATDFDFTINGVNYSLENIATTAVAAATATTATSGTETGFTLLVRNEATGNVEKLLAEDLLQSARTVYPVTAADETANSATITVTGVPLDADASKVWVYRNGAKLVEDFDFEVTTNQVALTPVAAGTGSWVLYTGDVIEIQWVK